MTVDDGTVWRVVLDDGHVARVTRTAMGEGLLTMHGPDGRERLHELTRPEPHVENVAAWMTRVASVAPGTRVVDITLDGTTVEEVTASRVMTVRLEYSATGEGNLVRVMVLRARNVDEALERYREKFHAGQDAAWNFFSRGVDVAPGVHRPWLESLLAPRLLDALERLASHAGTLTLDWHYNLS